MSEEMQYLQFGLNLLSTALLIVIFYVFYSSKPRNNGPKGGRP